MEDQPTSSHNHFRSSFCSRKADSSFQRNFRVVIKYCFFPQIPSSLQASRNSDRERETHHQLEMDLRRQLAEEREEIRRLQKTSAEFEVQLRKRADETHNEHAQEVVELRRKLKEAEETERSRELLMEQQRQVHFTAMQQWGDTEASMQKTTAEIMKKRRSEMKALQASLDIERSERSDLQHTLLEKEHTLTELSKQNGVLTADNAHTRSQLDDVNLMSERIKEELASLQSLLHSKEEDVKQIREIEAHRRENNLAEFKQKEADLLKVVEEARSGQQYQLRRFKDLKDRYLLKKKSCEECKQLLADSAQDVLELRVKVGTLESTDKHRAELIEGLEWQVNELRANQYTIPPAEDFNTTGESHFGLRTFTSSSPSHSTRKVGPSKLRWATTSPTHLSKASPFCSAVQPATPALPILDNGPTTHNPFSRDAPGKRNTFRHTQQPAHRQFYYDTDGRSVLAPTNKYQVPARRNVGVAGMVALYHTPVGVPVRANSYRKSPKSTPRGRRRRSYSEGSHAPPKQEKRERIVRSGSVDCAQLAPVVHEATPLCVPEDLLHRSASEMIVIPEDMNATTPATGSPAGSPPRADSMPVTQLPIPVHGPPELPPAPIRFEKDDKVVRRASSIRKGSVVSLKEKGSPRSCVTVCLSSSASESSSVSSSDESSVSTKVKRRGGHGHHRGGTRDDASGTEVSRGWMSHASRTSASPTHESEDGSIMFVEDTRGDTTRGDTTRGDESLVFFEEGRDQTRDGTELITLDETDEESSR